MQRAGFDKLDLGDRHGPFAIPDFSLCSKQNLPEPQDDALSQQQWQHTVFQSRPLDPTLTDLAASDCFRDNPYLSDQHQDAILSLPWPPSPALPSLPPLKAQSDFTTYPSVDTRRSLTSLSNEQSGIHADADLFDFDFESLEHAPPFRPVIPKILEWKTQSRPGEQLSHTIEPSPKATRLSEAGSGAFDAALDEHCRLHNLQLGNAVQSGVLLRSLWQLALGRESLLFSFNRERQQFEQGLSDLRLCGCSLEASQSFVDQPLRFGSMFRRLRCFVEDLYGDRDASAERVAFANAVDLILEAIEGHVSSAKGSKTFLQLANVLERPMGVLTALENLMHRLDKTAPGDEVPSIFDYAAEAQDSDAELYPILLGILERTAKPSLEKVETRLGLREGYSNEPLRDSLQDIDHVSSSQEMKFSKEHKGCLPQFIPETDRDMILETQECLLHLRSHQPNHLLMNNQMRIQQPPTLEWEFEWSGLERLEKKARDHEAQLIAAIRDCSMRHEHASECSEPEPGVDSGIERHGDLLVEDNRETEDMIVQSMKNFDSVPLQRSLTDPHLKDDRLYVAINSFLDRTDECSESLGARNHNSSCAVSAPPLSLSIHLSLSPLVRVCHRLVTRASLSSILQPQIDPSPLHQPRTLSHLSHSAGHVISPFLTHLQLHSAFSLFNSPFLQGRLQSLLFSTEMQGTERTKSRVRTGGIDLSADGRTAGMGMKVGSNERIGWPPASSEVQLALMGVVGDTWRQHTGVMRPTHGNEREGHVKWHSECGQTAADHIAFSIRNNLPEKKIQQVLEQSSIHALDFLRLTYKAPPDLKTFFPPATLDMYDRVFAMWLRFLRVDFALSEAFRWAVIGSKQSQRKRSLRDEPCTSSLDQNLHSHKSVMGFIWSVRQFLTSVESHFRLCGVQIPWCSFLKKLEATSHLVSSPISGSAMAPSTLPSVASLQEMHEQTLGTITSRLLLRKKQSAARGLLEDLCQIALDLVYVVVRGASGDNGEQDDIESLHVRFERQTEHFSSEVLKLSYPENSGTLRSLPEEERGYFEELAELKAQN